MLSSVSFTSTSPWASLALCPAKRGHNRAHPQNPCAVDVAHEVFDVGIIRVQQDMLRLALLHDKAVLQDHKVIGQLQRLIKIMRDEDDGLVQLFLQLEQQVLHVGSDQRIKGRESLVHQHDRCVCSQRPGNAHTLLHPTRKLRWIMVLEPAQTHAIQPFRGFAVAGASSSPRTDKGMPAFFSTVLCGNNANFWNTIDIFS